ncbi:MAG: DNA gyrase subunit A [Alphaproteobacteria bacterium]|nr:DNA gyrase subunit A [Alphaproteobacteria bacterium]
MVETTAEILPISIEDEMRKSYLDYAMSVIVSRAIPDVRDGLKPVHRRILFGMLELGVEYNKPYKKSARIVGDVMGKYHPHGDSAIYDSMVRMAQPFSMGLMLVDGQGNFGSMDGDNAAAMRYTESRLSKAAHALLEDIDKDTVNFHENYDGSEQEPSVLPARFPNLLVNGGSGIAVGMATNIPPHNLGEVIDATCAMIDNPNVTIEELAAICPGPDFPTGGIILGRTGSYSAMTTGRGSVVMRGKAEVEVNKKTNRESIIITEIPYQVNKARMIERMAELVKEKKIEGISDLRDESDKSGVRVVVEVKKDAVADVVLNQLYMYTPLQTSFGVNMLALNNGRPQLLNIHTVLKAFIEFREEVISRRTQFLLTKSRDRAHVLIGLAIAVANIDEVIAVIRASKDPVVAKEELMKRDWKAANVKALLDLVEDKGNELVGDRIKFTEAQAKAILELRLQRLTGLEQEKIDGELKELAVEIAEFLSILGSREKLYGLMRDELVKVKEEFAVPRRSIMEDSEFEADVESLIQREEMVVMVTAGGYIKRVPLAAYRAQKRGGKGRSGIDLREEDATTELFVASTHAPVLFFSSTGKVYKLKVYRLPLSTPQARGKALVNIFPLAEGETITNFMPLPEDESTWDNLHIFFSTAAGNVRRNDLSDFKSVMSNGKIAIKLDADDALVAVRSCSEEDHVLLCSKEGKAVRFPVTAVRVFKSRTSDGVRGMKLADKDRVVSMTILHGIRASAEEREQYLKVASARRRASGLEEDAGDSIDLSAITITEAQIEEMAKAEEMILTITELGFGKRTSAFEYRVTDRGGSGVTAMGITKKNGNIVMSFPVQDGDQIMLMTDKGTLIRTNVKDIRICGRTSQGVIVFRTDGEKVISATRIKEEDAVVDDSIEGGEGEAPDAPEATDAA